MKVSFARQVKEEVVFNDFDICCQKAILSAIIKVNGTLSLSNQGLLLTIRTENAKIASKVHKMLKEVYHPHIEFLVSRKMKLQKNNGIEKHARNRKSAFQFRVKPRILPIQCACCTTQI